MIICTGKIYYGCRINYITIINDVKTKYTIIICNFIFLDKINYYFTKPSFSRGRISQARIFSLH